MPTTTLQGYMSGGEMKLGNAVALARAAGVRVEWLATGEGPMREGEAPPAGLAEPVSTYRPAPLPPDEIDEANLAWALDFVEKQAPVAGQGDQRVPLMLSASAEFRRVQRMPPLPEFDAVLLGAALTAAEQLLRAAGLPGDPLRRVRMMLSIYSLARSDQVPDGAA